MSPQRSDSLELAMSSWGQQHLVGWAEWYVFSSSILLDRNECHDWPTAIAFSTSLSFRYATNNGIRKEYRNKIDELIVRRLRWCWGMWLVSWLKNEKVNKNQSKEHSTNRLTSDQSQHLPQKMWWWILLLIKQSNVTNQLERWPNDCLFEGMIDWLFDFYWYDWINSQERISPWKVRLFIRIWISMTNEWMNDEWCFTDRTFDWKTLRMTI